MEKTKRNLLLALTGLAALASLAWVRGADPAVGSVSTANTARLEIIFRGLIAFPEYGDGRWAILVDGREAPTWGKLGDKRLVPAHVPTLTDLSDGRTIVLNGHLLEFNGLSPAPIDFPFMNHTPSLKSLFETWQNWHEGVEWRWNPEIFATVAPVRAPAVAALKLIAGTLECHDCNDDLEATFHLFPVSQANVPDAKITKLGTEEDVTCCPGALAFAAKYIVEQDGPFSFAVKAGTDDPNDDVTWEIGVGETQRLLIENLPTVPNEAEHDYHFARFLDLVQRKTGNHWVDYGPGANPRRVEPEASERIAGSSICMMLY